jgi:hypothetical protein
MKNQLTRFLTTASLLLLPGLGLSSCVGTPNTFVQTMEASWAAVELREDLPYEKAWGSLVDILTKRFDIEMLSKDDGYLRTVWLYNWTGSVSENYRVRVTAKFTTDKKVCQVKSEAEYGGSGRWVQGYDSRLLETLKTDVMGSIGRATR